MITDIITSGQTNFKVDSSKWTWVNILQFFYIKIDSVTLPRVGIQFRNSNFEFRIWIPILGPDHREGTWLVDKKIFGAGVVNHPANPPMVSFRDDPSKPTY